MWKFGVASCGFQPCPIARSGWPPSDWAGSPPRSTSFSICRTSTTTPMSTRSEASGPVSSTPFHWFHIGQFLLGNFATFRLAYDLYLSSPFSTVAALGQERGRWTFDPALMGEVGPAWIGNCGQQSRQGRRHLPGMGLPHDPRRLSVAGKCGGRGDRDSIQVTYWRAWAASRNVRFIDGFAPFFREPAEIRRCANISSPATCTSPNSGIACFSMR